MTHEPPPRRRRQILKWFLAVLLLAVCAWPSWREYDHRGAVREAKAAGFEWVEKTPFDFIRKDWRTGFRRETWMGNGWDHWRGRHRELDLGKISNLTSVRPLLLRLRPTVLVARGCEDKNLAALSGVTSLQKLDLRHCPSLQKLDGIEKLAALRRLDIFPCSSLQNIDALKGLTGLQFLTLNRCPSLQDLGVLKELAGLQTLSLSGCPYLKDADAIKGLTRLRELHLQANASLQNLNALKSLTSLRTLNLTNCGTLQNVDVLKELSSLQTLDLTGCDNLPVPTLLDLRAAREGLKIQMTNHYFEADKPKKSP